MKKLIPFLLLSACTHGSFHADNDYFNFLKPNSDKYYSAGEQFTYSDIQQDKQVDYSLGSLIYTPSQKRPEADPEVLKRDRSYTGWLYLEYRETVPEFSWGLQVGCTGRCSQAKEIQSGVHKLLDQHVPTWDRDYTLKSEPGFILFGQKDKELYANDISDFSVYGLGKFGNIIDSGSGGGIYRLGHNLGNQNGGIIFKADRLQSPWIYYAFIKAEERLVAYNHMLEGSLWQNERHTVTPERSVQEGDVGFVLGYNNFKFGYTYTVFSNEWKERPGSFAFGGIDLSW